MVITNIFWAAQRFYKIVALNVNVKEERHQHIEVVKRDSLFLLLL